MDALLIAGFVLAVLALTLCLFLVLAMSYVLYKYVYTPWRVIRADLTALFAKVQDLERAASQARVMTLSNEEVARREARINARARAQAQEGLHIP